MPCVCTGWFQAARRRSTPYSPTPPTLAVRGLGPDVGEDARADLLCLLAETLSRPGPVSAGSGWVVKVAWASVRE
jgi:hypothetical protein